MCMVIVVPVLLGIWIAISGVVLRCFLNKEFSRIGIEVVAQADGGEC